MQQGLGEGSAGMQHEHVLKKLSFELLNSPPGSSRSVDKVFAIMLLDLCFHLIWYATWPCFEKVEFLHFDPTHSVGSRVGVCG